MESRKLRIAVIAGGYTGEHDVSLKSAENILDAMDQRIFDPYLIVWSESKKATDRGATLHYKGKLYPVDLNRFSVQLEEGELTFDYAFIVIHGSPGEDGKLQGYLDIMGIPYNTGGVLAQAITFHKQKLKELVKSFGILVPRGVEVARGQEAHFADNFIKSPSFPLPLFVKPCQGGSSIATTKITKWEQLSSSLKQATAEDLEGVALLEEMIQGTEVTCGAIRLNGKSRLLAITEVVPKGAEFFDFEAKYSGSTDEITPARIPQEYADEIASITLRLGDIIQLEGLYRADFIIDAQGTPYLLEVNTVPGMTSESFIPKQIKAAARTLPEVLSEIILKGYSAK